MASTSDDMIGADAVPDHRDDNAGSRSGTEGAMPRGTSHRLDRHRPDRHRSEHTHYAPAMPDMAPLARTIESEIIPRLMLLHREAMPRRQPSEGLSAKMLAIPNIEAPAIAERFLRILIDQPVDAAIDFIDDLLISDVPFERLVLELLEPAARKLGRLWEEDVLSFVEVTIAMSRLQQLIRVYGPALAPEFDPGIESRRIFISAAPGETHTFGASIAEAFFIRAGWDVMAEVGLSRMELLERVRTEWFDVVGLTASCDASVNQLSGLVRRIREASLNPGVKILLGGSAFLVEPTLALSLGADIEACAGPDVVAAVNRMMKTARLD
ncbi:MAG: cobalamin B12-binding domain-containing protein [Beijerinckiaceae bacterium]|nr:cobalamin B12-binding domain-containing protein [Beijerinckiaceae bacterium]MCZ8301429.1 cobalamin B12-binding domain-containing protein [Beijerinckiaceae bacterium]